VYNLSTGGCPGLDNVNPSSVFGLVASRLEGQGNPGNNHAPAAYGVTTNRRIA